MKRILVTGNAGSGKTTLSNALATQTQLPRYGLDSIVWKTGWQKAPDEEKREKISALVSNSFWVIDGVSGLAFRAADIIYFLDIPLFRCPFNILSRFLKYGFKTREGLPPGCPEYIRVFKAIRVAILYQRQTRPFILKLIEEHPEKEIIWIRSYSEIQPYY
jgi:adenylate kinase family enzyme